MADLRSEPYREAWLPVTAGISLYYRDYGTGTAMPVICLPGYWRTSRDFEELAGYLATGRRVVTVDLRGRGKSGRSSDPADYHFDRLVEDTQKLMNELGVTRAVLVGLALGAEVAMELAVRHPERVAGIVFNDSAPESNPIAGAGMKAFSGGDELSRDQALERIKAQYAEDCPRLGEADFDRLIHRNYARTDAGTYVRDFDQLTNVELLRMKTERPTFWKEFASIDAPVAVLRGANSKYLTEEIAARMLERNPRASLHTIPDCGHPVMLWEPETFAAIDKLLAQVDMAS